MKDQNKWKTEKRYTYLLSFLGTIPVLAGVGIVFFAEFQYNVYGFIAVFFALGINLGAWLMFLALRRWMKIIGILKKDEHGEEIITIEKSQIPNP